MTLPKRLLNEEEAVRLRDPLTATLTAMLEVTVMGTTAPYWSYQRLRIVMAGTFIT